MAAKTLKESLLLLLLLVLHRANGTRKRLLVSEARAEQDAGTGRGAMEYARRQRLGGGGRRLCRCGRL